jgi:hypothetical protein
VHAVVFLGGGGSDSASLTDRAASKALLRPGSASLTGKGYSVSVTGAGSITVNGGGRATVSLYGSKGNDTFASTPSQATLSGVTFHNQANGFMKVIAYSGGGKDTAALTGSKGADVFAGSPTAAALGNKTFADAVLGFARVSAAGGGGSDTAVLTGSKGNDTFTGSGSTALLVGPSSSYTLQVSHFHKVTAVGMGGKDRKKIHAIDYLFTASGLWS